MKKILFHLLFMLSFGAFAVQVTILPLDTSLLVTRAFVFSSVVPSMYLPSSTKIHDRELMNAVVEDAVDYMTLGELSPKLLEAILSIKADNPELADLPDSEIVAIIIATTQPW